MLRYFAGIKRSQVLGSTENEKRETAELEENIFQRGWEYEKQYAKAPRYC